MKKNALLIVLVCMLVIPLASQAQIGLGPVVGYHKAADADEGNIMVGGAIRLKLSPALGVEASINYRQEKFADSDLTVRSWPVMVSGMIYPLPIIYGVIGAGWYNTTFDYASDLRIDNETFQEFGWHFGGGVELPMGGATLIADIRYVFLDYEFDQLPTSPDLKSNFFVISVGVLFGLL